MTATESTSEANISSIGGEAARKAVALDVRCGALGYQVGDIDLLDVRDAAATRR